MLDGVSTARGDGPTSKKQDDPASTTLRPRGYYPLPPYPEWARLNRLQASGTVRTTFGPDGKVASVVMTESTGSRALDDSVINYIKQYWQSPPGKTYSHDTHVIYRLLQGGRRYYTPDPPYASSDNVAGSACTVTVRIKFEADGKVATAQVAKSSGNPHLDQITTTFIKSHWRSNLGMPEVKTAEIFFGRGAPLQ